MRLKASPNQGKQSRRSKKGKTRSSLIGIGLIVLVVAVALTTIALSRSSSQASQKRYVATKKVRIDQVTRQLRMPTPQEVDEIVETVEKLTDRSTQGLSVATDSSGVAKVDLENRFQNVMLFRANEDGSTETRCVTSMEEAAEFLGLVLADAATPNNSPD